MPDLDPAPLPEESSSSPALSIVNSLSLLVVFSYMLLMPLWIFYPPIGVPDGVLAIINQMMGAWGMAFATVIAFHLGSSKGAKDAQEAQRKTVNKLSSSVASTVATAATAATTAATVANTAAIVAGTAAAANGHPPDSKDPAGVADKPHEPPV